MRLAALAASASVDAVTSLCNGGTLKIFDGQKLLAALPLNAPAFQPARDGIAKLTPTQPGVAIADGTPTLFAICAADGTVVFTGRVPDELTLTFEDGGGPEIGEGAAVSVGELVYVQGKE